MAAKSPTFPWPDGKRAAVSLSFDDGRDSQIEIGIPILERHGVRGTFYVIVPNMEKKLALWKRAIANGHEIGNHTLSHPCTANFEWARGKPLESMTIDDMEADVVGANRLIREKLGVTPATFAYPCGMTFVGRGLNLKSYIPVIAKHFLAGRLFRSEVCNAPTHCDLAQVTGEDFDCVPFEQAKASIDKAVSVGGWLNLVGHDVGSGGRQTVLTDALDEVCRYCQDPANGIWIDTLANIAQHVKQNTKH